MDVVDDVKFARTVHKIASHLRRKIRTITTLPEEPPSEPCRFFTLPKEIRMRVYELLPLQIKHQHIKYEGHVCLTLVTRGLPLAILRTCSQAHDEAKPVLWTRAQREVADVDIPLRIILRGELDASLATRHNTILVLSALAYAIEAAKHDLHTEYKSLETLRWPAEDE
jgi:hypothetical protein